MARGGGCVVTVGTYDGVHLGHRRLLAESMAEGTRLGLPTVVVTFDRHPAEVVRPSDAPKLLTGLEHKIELLEGTGVDRVVVLHFDEARSLESAEDFVSEYLIGELGAVSVLVGSNFRFGYRHLGDVELLDQVATSLGRSARGIDLVIDDETRHVVSSTAIRGLVAAGEMEEARRLLGRPHELRGALSGQSLLVDSSLCLPLPGSYEVEIGAPREVGVPGRAVVFEDEGAGERRVELEPSGRVAPIDGETGAVRFFSRVHGDPALSHLLASNPEVDR